jgi:TRAP-type mannitol/chloroaromatic compound transport system substrate-binding protein
MMFSGGGMLDFIFKRRREEMRKRWFSLFMATAVALTLLCIVSEGSVQAKDEVIKWRAQSAWNRGDAFHDEAEYFVEAVKRMSGGRLVIPKMFAAGEIVGPIEAMGEASAGRLDLTHNSGMYVAGTLPYAGLSIGSRPGWTNENIFSQVRYLYEGGGLDIYNEYIQTKYNLISFPAVITASEAVYSIKPIRTIGDFKGLKIRTSGLNKVFFEELGCTCVSIPMTDVTPAMSRGELDACEMSSFYIDSKSGIEDVAKYVLVGYIHQPVGATVQIFINMESWKALPDDLKKIVEYAANVSMWHAFEYGGYMDQVIAEKWENKWEVLKVTPEMQAEFEKATERARVRIIASGDPWAKKILDHQKVFYDTYKKYAIEPW